MALPLAEVPLIASDDFSRTSSTPVNRGWRVSSYFGVPDADGATLYCVLAFKTDGMLGVMASRVGKAFPSISRLCPQVHLFEREIAEQCGIVPEGHPGSSRSAFTAPSSPERDAWGRDPASRSCRGHGFFRVEGEEVHEVAVGPVHAGIIEPGHFRFQCHGEVVFHLEISLGYQHRGIEAASSAAPSKDHVPDGNHCRRHYGRPCPGMVHDHGSAGRLPCPCSRRSDPRHSPGAGAARESHRRPREP